MTVAENVETFPQPREGNYHVTRFNALRHGLLSQYAVLPWEDGEEYRSLLDALIAGRPRSTLLKSWRASSGASGACAWAKPPRIIAPSDTQPTLLETPQKRRSSTGEGEGSTGEAIRATDEQTAADFANVKADQAMTEEALRMLTTADLGEI